MPLCVDLKSLPVDPDRVQKDVDLARVLSRYTRQFNIRGEAEKAGYAPLAFTVSVRTTYTNQVVAVAGDPVHYYTSVFDEGILLQNEWDHIIKVSSACVFQVCNYSEVLRWVMMQCSQFQPIGLANVCPGRVDPMIYSHVIIADEGADQFKQCLKPGNELVPIQSMRTVGNVLPLLDTLIIVDKEKDHA